MKFQDGVSKKWVGLGAMVVAGGLSWFGVSENNQKKERNRDKRAVIDWTVPGVFGGLKRDARTARSDVPTWATGFEDRGHRIREYYQAAKGRKEIEAVLKRRPRDVKLLQAVYFLTKDPGHLEELKRLATTKEHFAFLALTIRGEDRKEWAQKMQKADPENALGLVLEATRGGVGFEEVKQLLGEAAEKADFDTYQTFFREGEAELMSELGRSELELQLYRVSEDSDANQVPFSLIKTLRATKIGDGGDSANTAEYISSFVEIAELMEGKYREESVNYRVISSLIEKEALEKVPDYFEFGEAGESVGDRLRVLNERDLAAAAATKKTWDFQNYASEDDWLTYRKMVEEKGLTAAWAWVDEKLQ